MYGWSLLNAAAPDSWKQHSYRGESEVVVKKKNQNNKSKKELFKADGNRWVDWKVICGFITTSDLFPTQVVTEIPN